MTPQVLLLTAPRQAPSALPDTPPLASPRIGMVDTLRGAAAFIVVWFHAASHLHSESIVVRSAEPLGMVGVFMFFAISGFVIPFALDRGGYRFPNGACPFLVRRVVRLDPPYFASILLALGVIFASNLVPGYQGRRFEFTPGELAAHIAYLNGILGFHWVNGVYWTLSIEFQFYLLLALIFPLISHSSANVRRLCLFSLALLSLIPHGREFIELNRGVFVYSYLAIFGCGITAFLHYTHRVGTMEFLASMLVLCLIAGFSQECVVAAATSLAISSVRFEPGRVLRVLGVISYSLYLTHVPLVRAIVHLWERLQLNGVVFDLAVVVFASTVAVAFAGTFYWVIERPALRWSRRIGQELDQRVSEKGATRVPRTTECRRSPEIQNTNTELVSEN